MKASSYLLKYNNVITWNHLVNERLFYAKDFAGSKMSFLLTSEMFTLTIFDGNISEHTAVFSALVKYIGHSFASTRCQSFCLLYFNTVILFGATYFYL